MGVPSLLSLEGLEEAAFTNEYVSEMELTGGIPELNCTRIVPLFELVSRVYRELLQGSMYAKTPNRSIGPPSRKLNACELFVLNPSSSHQVKLSPSTTIELSWLLWYR
jgi:hypothetical protein